MSEASLEAAREALRLWASKYSNDVCVVSLTFRSDPVLKVLERTIADAIDSALREANAEIEKLRVDLVGAYESYKDLMERSHAEIERLHGELVAAREQGRAEAFDEIMKWHDAMYKDAAVMAETNGISGAHAAAHYAALEYLRSRSRKENEK